MSKKALSDFVVYSRYSKYVPEKKRRETWKEQVDRVFDMHERKFLTSLKTDNEFRDLFDQARESVYRKEVLGSQRALQFGGFPIERHNEKMYNCATTYIDRIEAFKQVMFCLLCGNGVGFSVQRHHVAKLPEIHRPGMIFGGATSQNFVIPDSIEGWADSIDVLVKSYFAGYDSRKVEFDYSEIRPEGAPISSGFKAPGPEGLRAAHEKIRSVFDKALNERKKNPSDGTDKVKLKPIEAYDMLMHLSDAVLSGGVRRSSAICLFSPDDHEMMTAKTGDWFYENPQRGRSNNSVLLVRDQTSKEDFENIMSSVRQFGEPGFVFAESTEHVYNPCITGDAMIPTRIGGKLSKLTMEEVVSRFQSGETIEVLSFDIKSQELTFNLVTNGALTRKFAEIIKLHCRDGRTLKCTPDHKIFVHGIGYVLAKDLRPGQHLVIDYASLETTNFLVSPLSHYEEVENEDVYDITVENNHNFFANDILVHNCVEIGMIPKTEDGRSGIQYCNLTEINGSKCKDRESFLYFCKMSAVIGTMQAAYSKFNYLGSASEEIVEREALLGCSITGWMDQPDVLFNEELQREGAKVIKETNKLVAEIIDINPAARCCCAKPSGSTSCVLGTSSGIHPHHAKQYIRNVQGNINEFAVNEFKRLNPIAVEDSVWDAQKKDQVLSFMCEVPNGAITKNTMSAIDLLEKVKLTQQNWVEYGTNKSLCVDPTLRHNVSNTITVKEDEWEDLTDYIYKNRKYFAGISLLPASGDLDYPQAPFIAVLTPKELVKEYGDASILASGLVVDGLAAFDNNLWYACDVVSGIREDEDVGKDVKLLPYPDEPTPRKLANYFNRKDEYETSFKKKDWVRRVRQFAVRHFDYDETIDSAENELKLKKCCACLKHVSLWKRWVDLKREYVEIDWSQVQEEKEEAVAVDTMGAQACAGGKCTLI